MDSGAAVASEFPRRPVSCALSVAAHPFSGAYSFSSKLLIICEPPPSAIRAPTRQPLSLALGDHEGSDRKPFLTSRSEQSGKVHRDVRKGLRSDPSWSPRARDRGCRVGARIAEGGGSHIIRSLLEKE